VPKRTAAEKHANHLLAESAALIAALAREVLKSTMSLSIIDYRFILLEEVWRQQPQVLCQEADSWNTIPQRGIYR